MPNALKTSQIALDKAKERGRIFRVCWETNGYWREEFALKAVEFSFISGGNVKFDLNMG